MTNHPYIQLFKPGIIMGNLITLWGAFFMASQGKIHLPLLGWLTLGTTLLIASGAAFNNVIDRDLDRLMRRTRRRALPLKLVTPRSVLIIASLFGLAGLAILSHYGSLLVGALALAGWLAYVLLYSLYGKRRGTHGVAVGSLSGAVPPMMGYCAVTQSLDWLAFGLGLSLCLWQIPHTYAIALRRLDDYRAAKLPLLPVVSGVAITQTHLRRYVFRFTVVSTSLWWLGPLGPYYGVGMLLGGLLWWRAAKVASFKITPNQYVHQWGLSMFGYSIALITLFSLLLALDPWLAQRTLG